MDISAHIKGIKHFVALVKDEMFQIGGLKVPATDKSEDASWCSNYDSGWIVLQSFDVLLDWLSSVHHFNGYLLRVHVLREPVVLFLDLEG